jgi:hypothetical protein
MGCRKNLAKLTPAERLAFVNAVLALKTSGKYDVYTTIHAQTMDPGGVMVHGMPLFFPWHRQLIREYERDLQAIDPSVDLPYWDWTVANLNPSGTESLIWRADFMGSPGTTAPTGPVTGPFAAWGFRRRNFDPFQFPGTGGNIATAMAQAAYNQFWTGIEGPHGAAHVWVGGDMGNVMTSPHDPTFFLLHCNVDRLWAEWIHAHQSTPGFQPYLPITGGTPGQNLNDTMWPWDGSARPVATPPWNTAPEIVRPADVIDHRALGYFYDTVDPECAPKIQSKELKDRLKDRLKEIRKEVIKSELKERIKELKERLPKELKERLPSEGKELRKDLKDRKEIVEAPGKTVAVEGRPSPFIGEELRPELRFGALAGEADLGEEHLMHLSEELQRQAEEAKTAKDHKDTEKLRER